MKRRCVSTIIAVFSMALVINMISCKEKKQNAERTANEAVGLGRLTNEEVEMERERNEESDLVGSLTRN